MMKLGYRLTLLALVAVVAACSADTGTDPQESDPVLAKSSGDAQTGDVSAALADPAVVVVTRDGSPLAGQTVTWTVTAGGGSVAPTSGTTAADGTAATTWTLGPTAGGNTLQAAVSGATGSPVTFTATGDAGPPPATASVNVDDNFFDPSSARVAVGGTVTWDWIGSVTHNVTFASGPNSGDQSNGASFMRTFSTAGSFAYTCTIHGAAMSGTVVVE